MQLFMGLKAIQEVKVKQALPTHFIAFDFMPFMEDAQMTWYARTLGIDEQRLQDILSTWEARGWWEPIDIYAGVFNSDIGACPTLFEFQETYCVPQNRLELAGKLPGAQRVSRVERRL